jgi:prepilin signal peptidase PulO-like enzyme (type II secretory pathway)
MVFLIALLGLVIGSFLNVVIGRLRTDERGWRSRSRCPDCYEILQPRDLIPVFSYVLLKAKCRYCHKHISWQYPLVEAITAGLFVWAYLFHGAPLLIDTPSLLTWLAVLRDFVFVSALVVIFVIDLLDQVVFDSVTLPIAAFALLINTLVFHQSWLNLGLAGLVGGGFFMLQWLVSRGRWIGGGDVRIGVMMGFMLGWPMVVPVLLLAYVLGSIVAIWLLVRKLTSLQSHMAFGTFLAVATVIGMFAGNYILAPYAAFFTFY